MPPEETLPEPSKEEADRLRDQYWFRGVRLRFPAPSLDALGEILNPSKHVDREARVLARSNTLRKYDKGGRSPRTSSVKRIDALRLAAGSGEGSAREFAHVVWPAFQHSNPAPRTVSQWLSQLDARVLQVARQAKTIVVGRTFLPGIPALQLRDYAHLSYLPKLDSLALVVIVIRLAHQFEKHALAFSAGKGLVRLMWLAVPHFEERGMAADVINFLETWVLPQTALRGARVSFGGQIETRVKGLCAAAKALDGVTPPRLARQGLDTRVREILTSRFSVQHRLEYMPVEVPIEPALSGQQIEQIRNFWLEDMGADIAQDSVMHLPSRIKMGWDPYAPRKRGTRRP